MKEEKHRIVIDTNLWISLLLTKDFSKFDSLISADRATLLISLELLEEIIEVAERQKFRKYFELIELTNFLVSLRQSAEFVDVSSQVNDCRDEKDNFLLSLAVDGKATHLLTGDKDLLVLDPFRGIEIQTIADYLFHN